MMMGDLFGNFVGMLLECVVGGWCVFVVLLVLVALGFYAYARKLSDSSRWEVLNVMNVV